MKRMKRMSILVIAIMLSIGIAACGTTSVDDSNGMRINDSVPSSADDRAEALNSDPSGDGKEGKSADIESYGQDNTEQPEDHTSKLEFEKVIVSRHVDGDTVYIKDEQGKEYKTRFIGVDCPESTNRVDPYGKEASQYTKSQLLGKTIYMEKDVSDTDRYGRLLRYIWLEPPSEINEKEIRDKMYNAKLLLEGYGVAATFPPDIRYADYFRKFAAEAKESEKGLWGITSDSSDTANTALSEDDVSQQYKYVGSKESDKYHYPDCRWVKNIKESNLVKFNDKTEAESMNYKPCGTCKP